MRITPCYDVVTKRDCPRRSATCHATCPEWKEYVEKRDKEYATRHAEQNYTTGYNKSFEKNLKYVQRKGRRAGRT